MREVQHVSATAGEAPFAVTAEAAVTSEGVACFVYGGSLPHVGGMALSAPGPTLHGRQLSRADVWSATVPGHKDAEAAQKIARKLTIALRQPVSVTCGIHVDDATPADLAQMGKNIDAAVDVLVDKLKGEKGRLAQLSSDAYGRESQDAARGNSPAIAYDAGQSEAGLFDSPLSHVDDNDQLILVDLGDREIGACGKLETHQRGLLHRAFSVFLFDGNRVLMTRRALCKYHSGGLWTNTCCSHPRVGETLAEAVPRRLAEELGIADAPVCREVGTYCYRAVFENGLTEYELDHVFVGSWKGTPTPDPREVMDYRWAEIGQVERDVCEHPERFTAWFPGVLRVALSA